ncbi:MAG: diaminopimelate decarboxylase [Bacteroidota bacterium]
MKKNRVAETGDTLGAALLCGMVREEDTAVILYDLRLLEERISMLSSCFPPNALHGLAIKANPLFRIMELTRSVASNTGVEAASLGEVTMALKAGYQPCQVVYDSPVKTVQELAFALKTGININVDNFSELARIAELMPTMETAAGYAGSIGLRINPQIGLGTILESSVAGVYSKFGVPVNARRNEIESAYLACPWLTGIHLHVGSQGCSTGMLVEGIGILYDLVLEINAKRKSTGMAPVSVFDIGGGLPISYIDGIFPPSMKDYAEKIAERAPLLFDPSSFKLITEFGRWVYTNCGWTVSRVEYVKHEANINTAMLHVGADLFVRECLNPRDWHHEYSVYNREGQLKTGTSESTWNLAGPLCFSGDIIAKEVKLPEVEEGDYLVIHDTGGYTFSMWSRYNSRQTPRIVGYRDHQFEILKERESLDELMGFWK